VNNVQHIITSQAWALCYRRQKYYHAF